mmetsp:Transcript_14377/g.41339  ORF Transcript_14377/g.41339 Transcript_14377/m.41339 type:complete len:103 (+) Transcript_14377:2206-2514(+)
MLGVTHNLMHILHSSSDLILQPRHFLAFVAMAIIDPIPMTRLTFHAAVTMRLAPLAELASIRIQLNIADFAGLPEGTQRDLDNRKDFCRCIVNLALSQASNR